MRCRQPHNIFSYSTVPSPKNAKYPQRAVVSSLARVEFPHAGEGVRGYTQWFSKRLSNCKRGRQLLRGHALQDLGSLPRCACARGGLSPGRSRGNAPFPRSADCRSTVNALWGPDLQSVGRSEFPAMMRDRGRFSGCCAPQDPSFMAGVEDLPSAFTRVST